MSRKTEEPRSLFLSKRLEDIDFGRVKGIGMSEAVNLLDCR
jgi:hypothetical protein